MEKTANKLQKWCRMLFLATIFLLPLKMGSMLLPGVPHSYPAEVFDLVINPLPPSAFAIWSAVLLLLALGSYGFPEKLSWKDPAGKLLGLFLLLPLTALLGFVNPDNWESAVIEFEYLLSVAAFAAASAIMIFSEPVEFRNKVMNTLAVGTVCTALAGVYQYFYGFEELKKFIEEQEKLHNIKFPMELKARAYDVRTYATFTFASALAGFLALAGALTCVRSFRAGSRFEPVKLSQKIFTVLAIILVSGIFLTTKGRSAFLSVIVAGALSGFLLLKSRKIKVLLAISAILAITAGAFYIHYAGRGFGSMTERVGYLQTSAKMLGEHPIFGAGWGSFTYNHALYKNFGNEELAKDPHNMIAAFASQTGIFGGLAVTMLLLYTLYCAARRLKNIFAWENLAIFFGLSAFSLHILMDLDWQVPALMAYYIIFAMLALPDNECDQVQKSKLPAILFALLGAVALTGGLHWALYENSFGKMLAASGQEAGVFQEPKSSYEVDVLAEKALKLAPYSASIYNAWALDKMRRSDFEEAEKLFLKTIELAPRSNAAHKSLSKVYDFLGKKDLAKKHADIADKLFPYRKILFERREDKTNE